MKARKISYTITVSHSNDREVLTSIAAAMRFQSRGLSPRGLSSGAVMVVVTEALSLSALATKELLSSSDDDGCDDIVMAR